MQIGKSSKFLVAQNLKCMHFSFGFTHLWSFVKCLMTCPTCRNVLLHDGHWKTYVDGICFVSMCNFSVFCVANLQLPVWKFSACIKKLVYKIKIAVESNHLQISHSNGCASFSWSSGKAGKSDGLTIFPSGPKTV